MGLWLGGVAGIWFWGECSLFRAELELSIRITSAYYDDLKPMSSGIEFMEDEESMFKVSATTRVKKKDINLRDALTAGR